MFPAVKTVAARQHHITQKSVVRVLRPLLLLIIGCTLAAMLVEKRFAKSISSKRAADVTIHVTDRERSWLKMQDGRALNAQYASGAALTQLLQSDSARPLTLATGDLDRDGAPDL